MTFLKKLRALHDFFFGQKTLEEHVADHAEAASLEERQSIAVITAHRFQRHMARAKLDAIQVWREQEGWTSGRSS